MLRYAFSARSFAIAIVTAVLLAALAVPAAQADDDPANTKLLLMLDASGSMNEPDPSGLTKIDAAKRALTSVVAALPADSQVGLRVYGATVEGGTPTPEACADTQLVHPITTLDKPGLTTAITTFTAKGETPIAGSLQAALGDLGTTGKRNIVLVSDGKESCVPDPCPVIKDLIGQGINLQIDTVGFGVDDTARSQLQCLADAGHGTYYDATNADELTVSLTKLGQRALRPYQMLGDPIAGGIDPASAPAIGPGQYLDSAPVADKPVRYYRLKRTPGSSVRVSLTAKAPQYGSPFNTDGWNVPLYAEDGKTLCEWGDAGIRVADGSAATVAVNRVFGPALEAGPSTNDASTPTGSASVKPDPCQDGDLIAGVRHFQGPDGDTPYELRYVEEPAVTTTAGLPAALTDGEVPTKDRIATQPDGPASPIVGGGSFNDAVTLSSGRYSDTLLADEEVFYRVHLDAGQSVIATLEAPAPGTDLTGAFTGLPLIPFGIDLWGINREPMGFAPWSSGSGLWTGVDTEKVTVQTPQVRYLNRHSLIDPMDGGDAVQTASLSGDYYISIHRLGKQAVVPVQLTVEVLGTAQGEPAYVGSEAPQEDPALPQTQGGTADTSASSWLPWAAGGLITVLVVAAGTAILVTQRRRPRQEIQS